MELEEQTTTIRPHLVTVHVNDRPVNLAGPKRAGLEIKEAAVNQGVPIQLDFALSELLPNGGTRAVGNSDEVTVTKESRFTAIDVDDNS
ncbi:MAG: hypothetical protein E6J14_12755 [Chloroflexi bacterium]|nr:MAG: hypothetical protein E6J14_12755 [Chloroflexota bacterium]